MCQCRKIASVDLQIWLGWGKHKSKKLSFLLFKHPKHIAAVGEGVVEYLEERQAEFSEVYFPFITFLSIGEPDWEWGSYQIPISLFSLWMFPV